MVEALYREDWRVHVQANTLQPGPEHDPVPLGTVAAMLSSLLSGRSVIVERRPDRWDVHALVCEQTLRVWHVPEGDLENDLGEALTTAENAWASVCEERLLAEEKADG